MPCRRGRARTLRRRYRASPDRRAPATVRRSKKKGSVHAVVGSGNSCRNRHRRGPAIARHPGRCRNHTASEENHDRRVRRFADQRTPARELRHRSDGRENPPVPTDTKSDHLLKMVPIGTIRTGGDAWPHQKRDGAGVASGAALALPWLTLPHPTRCGPWPRRRPAPPAPPPDGRSARDRASTTRSRVRPSRNTRSRMARRRARRRSRA